MMPRLLGRVPGRYGTLVSVSDLPGASAARQTSGPPVRSLSSDQQPATKADLYAAVDAMRADMRELLEQISTLIKDAQK